MKGLLLFILCALFCGCQSQPTKESSMSRPTVTIHTNKGNIQIELFEDKAPLTVANFLRYVDEKHYHKTIFHRVINDFMIQGGGFTADMKQKATHDPIRNEADNHIPHTRGTVAMARTSEIHSATSQFFINVSDNEFLNYRNPTPSGFGYCVFGKIISGMDIVDQIKETKTGSKAGQKDVPIETMEILKITRN